MSISPSKDDSLGRSEVLSMHGLNLMKFYGQYYTQVVKKRALAVWH
jgi:hypothetical protein